MIPDQTFNFLFLFSNRDEVDERKASSGGLRKSALQRSATLPANPKNSPRNRVTFRVRSPSTDQAERSVC